MLTFNAISLSEAGDKYIGRSYKEMDCQAFVERCMADVGYKRDLGGSNSWYRECMKNGWVGTPEECMRLFGLIPKGALLFICSPVSENTPVKFRNDGIGDVDHMGIKTGRGKGAIHSSESRGGVAESDFHDKTIKKGGWNRVGLLMVFTYGKTIDWFLSHSGIGDKPVESEKEMNAMQGIVRSEGGGTINLRSSPKKAGDNRIAKIPSGSSVEIIDAGIREGWSKIKWNDKTGYVMSEFRFADDSMPSEDPSSFDPVEETSSGSRNVSLVLSVEECAALLPLLQSLCSQIIKKAGEG